MFICPPRAYTQDGLETISELTGCETMVAPDALTLDHFVGRGGEVE